MSFSTGRASSDLMELIQSSFQSSFNARVERLNDGEMAELRAIFRFFDTNSDGAIDADQACRIFGMLGLDVNPVQVKELDVVYLAEFIKIVDSHVPIPPPATTVQKPVDSAETALEQPHIPTLAFAANGDPKDAAKDEETEVVLDEEALEKRKIQLWEDEWKLIDSYRKGSVSFDELRSFLSSCSFLMPVPDLIRFLEMYADPTLPEELMVLTKAGFLRFRREYSNANDAAASDHELSSDDEGGEGDFVLPEFTARGTNRTGSTDPDASVDGDASESARASEKFSRPRFSKRRSSLRSISLSGEIVVDPGAIDQSDDEDEDDEPPPTGVQEGGLDLPDFGFE